MHVVSAPPTLTVKGLSALTYAIAADPARWSPLIEFREEQRYWARLATPEPLRDSADLWLLTWLPGQETEPHDHGFSAAAFRVLRGDLTEIRWSPDGSRRERVLSAGSTQEVAPGVIHDVINRGPEPAVSIHAYSPRLSFMRYYRPAAGGRLQAARLVETDNPESEWVR